jgi:hypothetical protein
MFALRHNALFVAGMPILAVGALFAWRGSSNWRGIMQRHSGKLLIAVVTMALLFGIARNMPLAPFDSLAPTPVTVPNAE